MLSFYNCKRFTIFGACRQPLLSRKISNLVQEPLRILFCGSDEFSTASLKRLHAEHEQDKGFIESIDVVCKIGKPSGRGMKNVKEVPLKQVARTLNLPVHEIPTFTGWEAPLSPSRRPTNLIIAVSFGLLVPPRILGAAEFGGLNVHPSLLPEFRGPAPLQHTLLHGRRTSGITVQTLHPKHFDHGHILSQIAYVLPKQGDCTHAELVDHVKPLAANILVDTLREGLFRSPGAGLTAPDDINPSHAPKLTRDDARIDWQTWPSDRILRTQRAVEPLWNVAADLAHERRSNADLANTRIQWHGLKIYQSVDVAQHPRQAGGTLDVLQGGKQPVPGIWACDGHFLSAESVTIAGKRKQQSADSAIAYLIKALSPA